jgi:hypothetical protein
MLLHSKPGIEWPWQRIRAAGSVERIEHEGREGHEGSRSCRLLLIVVLDPILGARGEITQDDLGTLSLVDAKLTDG